MTLSFVCVRVVLVALLYFLVRLELTIIFNRKCVLLVFDVFKRFKVRYPFCFRHDSGCVGRVQIFNVIFFVCLSGLSILFRSRCLGELSEAGGNDVAVSIGVAVGQGTP
uniref:Uncharacterized protein n=1 Tax=Cacopsylla melanoneura TaxID=428564 RepID=A0A8D8UHI0_9HEMI